MAVLSGTTKDGKELIVTCNCGCDEGLRIKIDDSDDDFSFMSYLSGKFYTDQCGTFSRFKEKCKKIWRAIRNKDHYYADIVMNRKDFETFREYVNKVGKEHDKRMGRSEE